MEINIFIVWLISHFDAIIHYGRAMNEEPSYVLDSTSVNCKMLFIFEDSFSGMRRKSTYASRENARGNSNLYQYFVIELFGRLLLTFSFLVAANGFCYFEKSPAFDWWASGHDEKEKYYYIDRSQIVWHDTLHGFHFSKFIVRNQSGIVDASARHVI